MTTQSNTAQNPGKTQKTTQRLIKLHAMLSVSYGSLIIDLTEAHNTPCVPGDLRRLANDAKALADFANVLAQGGNHE